MKRPHADSPRPPGTPATERSYTAAILKFLKEAHGNIRQDAEGDYYYNSVSTISLHFLLQTPLPGKEVLWRWYLHFDRGRAESIYQTLPPQRDEEFLSILESCDFPWDAQAVRDSGLVFLAQHRAEVYLAMEEFIQMRMDAYTTLDDDELRAALTPRLTWSESHLRKLIRQVQTERLSPQQRQAIYSEFDADYVRATARYLMDEATTESFWKRPPPELEALNARCAVFARTLGEHARRLRVYVSRQEFESQHGERHRQQFEGFARGRTRAGAGRSARSAAEEHFATLGLKGNASLQDVKLAYRERVKQHHPDQGGTVEDFLRVQEAYEYLLTQVF